MEWIEGLVGAVNTVLWDYALLFLLVATGIYFTVRLGFVQLRKFGEGMRRLLGGFSMKGARAGKEGMSSFQALTTAIAAQVGTGNITGCATALYSGGPGAIFWMWLSAFFGMATIYSEALLAQKFRTVDQDGHVTGGPIYYIRAAFQGKFGKFLSGFFAVAIILALGFMLPHRLRYSQAGGGHRGGGHCRLYLPGRRTAHCLLHREDRPHHGPLLYRGLHRHPVHQPQRPALRPALHLRVRL